MKGTRGLAPFGAVILGLAAFGVPSTSGAAVAGGTLAPTAIPKYVEPLVIPPAMPRAQSIPPARRKKVDYYEIAVRQFQQQVLPSAFPKTTVWSYGSAADPATFNYPAFTIEATYQKPVRVKWINDLKDASGNFLPHLLPIDRTLHWANPPGGRAERDTRPSNPTAAPYRGPVPIVTHVHGAHVASDSDGYPEAWYLPAANNIEATYATVGSRYEQFKRAAAKRFDEDWEPGSAVFQYDNDQRATTLWYHDHTLGMTRTNVYAGPAGFYLLRGGPDDAVIGTLPGPAPALGDLPGTKYYEIPIAIQDRSFNDDASLFYPDTREFFDGFHVETMPGSFNGVASDISPIWNPEFFGNTIVVNGKTWPYLEVEQRRYRFRFLNGSQSRFLILTMSDPTVTFWQIGTEGGFIPKPIELPELLLGPAERADVIVDFSNVPAETSITLVNLGPDEPFGGGIVGIDFDPSDPMTTGQVMQFRVVPSTGRDLSTAPQDLVLPATEPLPAATYTRRVSLNELDSNPKTVCVKDRDESPDGEDFAQVPCDADGAEPFGPKEAMLGTVMRTTMPDGSVMTMGHPMMWGDAVTENPAPGGTEIWEIYNFTMDAHPIHIHQVMFEVVDREPFNAMLMTSVGPRPPELWETGAFKDTVIAYPGEITRVKARFDLPGLYVWHCHILEHEDNEMMRPYCVGKLKKDCGMDGGSTAHFATER
jgi:bilirubin oxidase